MTLIHSQRTVEKAAGKHLLSAYRGMLSSLAEMERELVAQGLMRPEERRIYSRAERRAVANGGGKRE